MSHLEHAFETPRDFRAFLRSELVRRIKSNPRYSLRAFARSLDHDVSSISKMLNGKRNISPKLIQSLGKRIGLDDQLIRFFVVQELGVNTPPQAKSPDFAALPLDIFSTISDWYHFAILELMYLPNFKQSPRWIAKALGLQTREVEIAIHRLRRVGLLEVVDGKWKEPKGDKLTNLGPEATSFASKAMQKGLLLKALQALEEVPITHRENSSVTMAISTKKIRAAKERIKLFRREMSHYLSRGETPDDVYAITISLFPLTAHKRKK